MTDTRVFVTGFSALTASGNNAAQTWQAILSGQSGLGEISQWPISSWPTPLGGELKHFEPARMLPDRKLLKVISRQDVMGIQAAIQAVEHSNLLNYRTELSCPETFNEKTGIYVGSPGNKYFQQYDFLPLLAKTNDNLQEFALQLTNEVHPMWLLRILPNNVLAYTGITYGFKGPNHNITNHAVSGTQAILEAYQAIKHGQAERAVVIAYDMGIEPQALFYYDQLGVISSRHLKPFDREHDGTILAEGAAALVLESETSVKERGALCYGEVMGGACASEGAGLFSIGEGEELANLLKQTLDKLTIHSDEIALVVAHGNGNKKSDESEAYAICNTLGSHSVPVTAFKWAMGHTLCASGIVDTVLTLHALQEACIPGIPNLNQLASGCEGLNAKTHHRELLKKRPYALMINRGFASMNACLVIKACD